MGIYITGDTHGDFKRFTKKNLKKLPFKLTEKDYIIVCGDLGLLWEYNKTLDYNLNWLSSLPFKLLWVQGNHENYNMIEDFPLEEWRGGKARHIVKDKIILLERGQVFTIENKTFFTFGGAESHDIKDGILDKADPDFKQKKKIAKKNGGYFRILNETWWKQELPTQAELEIGLSSLSKVSCKVDYIITHCVSTQAQNIINISQERKENNILTQYFNKLEKEVKFKEWYFGHYHQDNTKHTKYKAVYKNIIKLE